MSAAAGHFAESHERDLYCLRCGYNLRGLAGDPLRCPECAFENPVGDVALPAPMITEQLKKMESAPAYSVLALLLIAFMGGTAAWLHLRTNANLVQAPAFLCAIVVAISVLPMTVLEARRSCKGTPGWAAALLAYHVHGFALLFGVYGSLACYFWLAGNIPSFGTKGVDRGIFILCGALVMLVLLARTWIPWQYRLATRRLQALQREVAVQMAREVIRAQLARMPRRGWLGLG